MNFALDIIYLKLLNLTNYCDDRMASQKENERFTVGIYRTEITYNIMNL